MDDLTITNRSSDTKSLAGTYEDYFVDIVLNFSPDTHSLCASKGLQFFNSLGRETKIEEKEKEFKLKCISQMILIR